MNIRVLAFAAVGMGALVLAVTGALPWIAEHSYAVKLQRYGAEHLASSMAREALAGRWVGILVSALLGATSVAAGLFLLRHKRAGARLWLGVCACFVVYSIAEFAFAGLSAPGVIRLLFWGVALLVSVPVLRRQGPAWFGPSA